MNTSDRIVAMARAGIDRDAIAAILDSEPGDVQGAFASPEAAEALTVATAGGGAAVTDLMARMDSLEQAVIPPRASAGGVVSGVTISYGVGAGGRVDAVLNKRGSGSATALFGLAAATRGDLVDWVTAHGIAPTWYSDTGTHDILDTGAGGLGIANFTNLTLAQFEADLVTMILPAWGDPFKVPAWMP